MIWNPGIETMARAEMEALQLHRLKRLAAILETCVPWCREQMEARKVGPRDIRALEDIARFPCCSKYDLRDNYPFGLLARPMRDVVRIHSSSGTTGKPVVAAYTQSDINLWTEVMARSLTACGVGQGDIIQNAYGYGLFTGGLGVHYGGERVGATVIPISGGNSKRQMMLLSDIGATVLTCTPSYALHLAEIGQAEGFDVKGLNLKVGIFGAEPWTEGIRQEIEAAYPLEAYDIYGLTEIIGPGVGIECRYHDGLHIFEDVFYPEIIDPDTLEPIPEGAEGELVITTLTKEAFPLLRFRTRDICSLTREPCRCGRTLCRISRIKGRTDDMLIIRGVNVFPSQIEEVLMNVEGTAPHYQLVLMKEGSLDVLEVRIEVQESIFSDQMRRLERLERAIREELFTVLGLTAQVRLVEPRTIARSEGKAQRIVDMRQKG
ncbi:MAG: phenylacetate--CoA ligase [Armatimonadetes bacterium]|nr:phenylacetate--CoA ligase [Armatimonadota bacterium]